MTSLVPAIGLYALLAASAPGSAVRGFDDVSALMRQVEDAGGAVASTRAAIQELGRRREARAVPALVKALFQARQGRTLESEAAFALFQIGRASSDALLRVVRRADPELLAWGAQNHVSEPRLLAIATDVLADLGDPRAQAPLLELLRYENAEPQTELAVRREAAKALGRLHSKAAVAPLTRMVATFDTQARHELVHALVAIGGREALPALARAAGEGSWDVRKIAMHGFTLLGDGREQATYRKILEREEQVITSDCRKYPELHGCADEKVLLERMLGGIRGFARRLEAAARCKRDRGCWEDRLKDPDPGVRERAVWELSRQRSGATLDALFSALGDADAAVRFSALTCLAWLLASDDKARARSEKQLPVLEARLAQGQGTVAGARFAPPLRRLIHHIRSPLQPRNLELSKNP